MPSCVLHESPSRLSKLLLMNFRNNFNFEAAFCAKQIQCVKVMCNCRSVAVCVNSITTRYGNLFLYIILLLSVGS